MKSLAAALILFFVTFQTQSQMTVMVHDSTELPAHSLRVIATVKSADYEQMVIVIETIIAYSRGVTAMPSQGDELTVRLPGRNKPHTESRIEVDLKESLDVGALPSSYIMLDYRTID